jgi:hypothetical protein
MLRREIRNIFSKVRCQVIAFWDKQSAADTTEMSVPALGPRSFANIWVFCVGSMNLHFLLKASAAKPTLQLFKSLFQCLQQSYLSMGEGRQMRYVMAIKEIIIPLALYMELQITLWRQEGIRKLVLLCNHVRIKRLIWKKKSNNLF